MGNLFKRIVYFFAVLVFAIFVVYLLLPSPRFPKQPADSVQSLEEADTESPFRRAYFTNYTRDWIVEHYQNQFMTLLGVPLPTYRLNYPPEDAFQLIRDQTRSTYLEEIIHPFRESIFINGFVPTLAKDAIGYRGVRYYQKITIRYTPSSPFIRVPILAFALISLFYLTGEWIFALRDFFKNWSGR